MGVRREAGAATLVTTLVWVCALATATWRLVRAGHGEFSGYDFAPLYGAGLAERLHEPLYAVPNFVYPPLAAVVFVPLSLLAYPWALLVYRVLAMGALAATCVAATAAVTAGAGRARRQRSAPARWWTPAASAGLCVVVLLLAHSTARSLGLANASLFLPLALVAACWAWGRGRWSAGTALLIGSLIVKPVLLTLLALPVARRRWRDLVLWCGIGGLLSVAALVASAGAQDIPSVVAGLLHATHFRGRAAALNLSFAGIARVHHVPAEVVDAVRLATLAWAALVTTRWAVRHPGVDRSTSPDAEPQVEPQDAGSPIALTVALATVLAAALFLAGSISEVHYLLVLAPGVVVALGGGRRWSAVAGAAAAAAYLAAGASHLLRTQELLVSAQLLALLACSIVVWRSSVQVGRRRGEVLRGQAAERGDQGRFPDEKPALGA